MNLVSSLSLHDQFVWSSMITEKNYLRWLFLTVIFWLYHWNLLSRSKLLFSWSLQYWESYGAALLLIQHLSSFEKLKSIAWGIDGGKYRSFRALIFYFVREAVKPCLIAPSEAISAIYWTFMWLDPCSEV